jgi:hypothetical protein
MAVLSGCTSSVLFGHHKNSSAKMAWEIPNSTKKRNCNGKSSADNGVPTKCELEFKM